LAKMPSYNSLKAVFTEFASEEITA
jgi:hypothetical protein